MGCRVQVPAGTVADVVAAAIAKTPEATALWFEGREVSYREFGARVNTLARRLIEAGVGPESAVAVRIPAIGGDDGRHPRGHRRRWSIRAHRA